MFAQGESARAFAATPRLRAIAVIHNFRLPVIFFALDCAAIQREAQSSGAEADKLAISSNVAA
jgi:hypothetical protein